MKRIIHLTLWVSLGFLVLFDFRLSTCLAQGSLTPPGAPGPLMKTLSQIEPRTDVLTLSGDSGNQYIITNSGSYYLSANIVGVSSENGIEVLTNNVALDLNGFSLLGVPGSGNGIVTGAITNLTVRNGIVSSWGGHGININPTGFGSAGVHFEHLTLSGNANFGINNNGFAEMRDCMVLNNASHGIFFGDGGTVANCTVTGNGAIGIVMDSYTNSIGAVRDCHVDGNHAGIFVAGNGAEVSGNVCSGNNPTVINGFSGILMGASNCRIENNHVIGSGYAGILVSNGSYSNNIIIRNCVSGSGTNNYGLGTNTQIVGPIITNTASGIITNLNPWANFSL